MSSSPLPNQQGFDPTMAGKRAECDGGGPLPGTQFAGRQEFTGTLTGDYIEHGDPPWRWYLMVDLVKKPANFCWDAVWCESGFLFVDEESTGAGS
jgi:hypothetical protein